MQAVKELSNAAWVDRLTKCSLFNCLSYDGAQTFDIFILAVVLISGPSCSMLTTSLVNDLLKFTSSDMQIC